MTRCSSSALDELIQLRGVDGAINLLADRIDKTVPDVGADDEERLRRAGRAYELRCLTRDGKEAEYLTANPYCDFCGERKPAAQVGTIRGHARCHDCEREQVGEEENEEGCGWLDDTNSYSDAEKNSESKVLRFRR